MIVLSSPSSKKNPLKECKHSPPPLTTAPCPRPRNPTHNPPRAGGGRGLLSGGAFCVYICNHQCLHLYRLVFTSVTASVYICNRWRGRYVAVRMRMLVAPVKYYGGLPPLSSSSPAALRLLLPRRVHLPEKVPYTHPPAPNHHLGIVSPT